MKTVDGVVVVERGKEFEFAGAVPLVAAYDNRVLRSVLADGPEEFVLYLVPNPGIASGGLVQEFHHYAGLVAVALSHERPDVAGALACGGVDEERLFRRTAQVKVMARALVQVENDVEVGFLDFLQRLVEQPEYLLVGCVVLAFE